LGIELEDHFEIKKVGRRPKAALVHTQEADVAARGLDARRGQTGLTGPEGFLGSLETPPNLSEYLKALAAHDRIGDIVAFG
jgi:hypothetical protein